LQRDGAAEWVSYGQKWKTGTVTDIIGLPSNTTVFEGRPIIGQQSNQIQCKNAK